VVRVAAGTDAESEPLTGERRMASIWFMPAYLIARVQVTDWSRYREYTKATPAAIERFGGRFIARGGETVTLEGPEETGRVVVIEFPTLDQARAFYSSEEYTCARKLREGAATGQFVLIEGCSG